MLPTGEKRIRLFFSKTNTSCHSTKTVVSYFNDHFSFTMKYSVLSPDLKRKGLENSDKICMLANPNTPQLKQTIIKCMGKKKKKINLSTLSKLPNLVTDWIIQVLKEK